MMIGEGIWLQSELFKPEAGEDLHTNSGCYGKVLAEWIAAALKHRGIAVEGVLSEDWGWCVIVCRDPYLIWVGCGNVQENPLPEDLTWHCFVEADMPLWRFWSRWKQGSRMRDEGQRIHALLNRPAFQGGELL